MTAAVIQLSSNRGAESLFALAYERLEDLIVHCKVAPGASLTTKTLQDMVGVGRTPVNQAVRRLAAETLILVRPRDGIQISPIDLGRDRRLLQLRRDMDRFVVDLATDKQDSNHRNRLLHLGATMRERRDAMDVQEFNDLDRQLDTILLTMANEPFLDRTLRPLHTIFRRIGNVYLTHLGGAEGLFSTIDHHLILLDAVIAGDRKAATKASDRLIDFADSMFGKLEGQIAPQLLNASL